MKQPKARRAFTLIELLVVVAIIALLIAILLPSLQRAREQGRKAKCLANLANVGKATLQYAEEDELNQIMPVHRNTVTELGGSAGMVVSRGASWFAWGGRAAPDGYDKGTGESSGGYIFLNENRKGWGASDRPLSKFMYPTVSREERNLPSFFCPSDTGYINMGKNGSRWVNDDINAANYDRPLYNIIGNSYRGSLAGYGPTGDGRFAIGILGQKADKMLEASRMLWGGEPNFYAMIGTDASGGFGQVKVAGWHGEIQLENELFADGSARAIKAKPRDDPSFQFSSADLEKMGIQASLGSLITRGPNWKIDSYPNPGAQYGSVTPPSPDASKWPMKNAYKYPLPEGTE